MTCPLCKSNNVATALKVKERGIPKVVVAYYSVYLCHNCNYKETTNHNSKRSGRVMGKWNKDLTKAQNEWYRERLK